MSTTPSSTPRCHLTPRDFSLLEEMLENRAGNPDEAFLRLLRRKLSAATVVFPDDIDARVAAIGSRVEFAVNDAAPEDYVLVRDGGGGIRGRVLPVTTRWGLALLGLAAGETIAVEGASGAAARLRLQRVEQPPQGPAAAGAAATQGSGATVLDFSRRAAPPRKVLSRNPCDPDNDPGPSAA